ncbi:hypothetical protein GGX14DRAFT_542282 [Mycena pura]|uniref:Uncharacterized protein n=1 Tax=Mycena pura TaxID=153505 RepID=A0AAD6YFF1_9AGAR|nr:hypothetical protein GGX14DRAFT_542282 [Mycena pura]
MNQFIHVARDPPRTLFALSKMTLLIRHVTVGEAATVINVFVTFFEYSLALAIVALLVYFTPPVHSALAWNVIGRSLHSSLWPTILRTDSTSARGTGLRVAFFTYLSFAVTILVAVAGVVMPLGLKNGPMLSNPPQNVSAAFIKDTSPIGMATSSSDGFTYSRVCGALGPMTCPGNSDGNTTAIAPEIFERFSTPYGPFGMLFRQWYEGLAGYNYLASLGIFSTTESLILRNGIFAVDGLVVDMDTPGVGLWNHTLPTESPEGAVWSEDLMWLEPVTACVDTNLTLDYILTSTDSPTHIEVYNITDRGGFFNLTHDEPPLDRDGQNIDVLQHAYKGTVLSNFYAMDSFKNLTRNESYYGRTFLTNESLTNIIAGTFQLHDLLYLWSGSANFTFGSDAPDLRTLCQGYGGADSANISNVAVTCNLLIAPPTRSDGGDPRKPDLNSTWTQRMYGCASTTRARMQRAEFSFNGTKDLNALSISRSNIDTPVLWATEKTELNITDIDVFWGRVPDSYENDDALWTTRSDVLYIPAGGTDISGFAAAGQPSTLPALAWSTVANGQATPSVMDYSGQSNFALLSMLQNLIIADPTNGAAQMLNMMWTDLIANNMRGSDSRSSLLVQKNVPSVAYDMRYAAPGILLLAMWVPVFGGAAFVLVAGLLKFSYLRHLLTHTGAGRIALGSSALKPMHPVPTRMGSVDPETERKWALGAGRTPVAFQPVDYGFSMPFSNKGTEFSAVANQDSPKW